MNGEMILFLFISFLCILRKYYLVCYKLFATFLKNSWTWALPYPQKFYPLTPCPPPWNFQRPSIGGMDIFWNYTMIKSIWINLVKFSSFIVSSYSEMEQICLISLRDINHGLIIFPTWSKMAHGVITWFSMGLQTAMKRTFMWLAASQITVTLLSGLLLLWSAPAHLCWAMFMKSTTSACNPNKVRLHASHWLH